MTGRESGVLAHIDVGVLGTTMLEAAQAARIGVAVTIVDPPMRNVYANEAAAQLIGWPLEDVMQRPMSIIAPEHHRLVRDRLERRAGGEAGATTYELDVVRRDGTRTTLEVSALPVTIEGRHAVFAFLVDVSARKAAEAERVRSEARFRELIEVAPEPIGIVRSGRYVYANRACAATLGFDSLDSLYGTPLDSLLEPEDAALRGSREAEMLAGGGAMPPHTYQVRRPDGATVLLEVSEVRFEYEGKPCILTVARDIMPRKRLETQLVQADRLRALGTMAAGVAHEINNPLAYVMLNLDWLARKLPEAARDADALEHLLETVEEARHGAKRVSNIVRELRSFARVDTDTRRRVDLGAVVRVAIKIVGHEMRHRARVMVSTDPVQPVWADESRLEQVVVNLLMNAAQALPEARADSNEIRIVVRPEGDARAVLEVSDNGPGIPADVLPHVFDPFFTTKPVGVGTGLGLSICHGIVTALGGQITASSEPGRGATFRVVMPTTDAAEGEKSASPNAPRSPRPTLVRGARVLVVDDEPLIARMMCELLGGDHEVVVATSGREALSLLRADDDFDVVFCDLMMPGTSGIDVYERIRTERPGIEDRFVFMTGGAFTERAADFLASVPNRRVDKPFGLDWVERVVGEMMGTRQRSGSR